MGKRCVTVKQAIEELQKLDPDAELWVMYDSGYGFSQVGGVADEYELRVMVESSDLKGYGAALCERLSLP